MYSRSITSRSRLASSSVRSRTRGIGVDLRLGQDLTGSRTADAVDIRECHFNPLIAGKIDASDSSQSLHLPSLKDLPLDLLMSRVFADDHHFPVTANHLALFTNALYRWTHFHLIQLLFRPPGFSYPLRRKDSLLAVGDPPTAKIVG